MVGPESSVGIEGFIPFPSARGFDAPGQIYRVDPNGNVYSVIALEILPLRGKEILPFLSSSMDLSIRQALEAIGLSQDPIYALGEGTLAHHQRFQIQSVNGTREYLNDSMIDDILPRIFRKQNVRVRRTDRYYVIRETISTDNISYETDKSTLVTLGIWEPLIAILKGQSYFKLEMTDKLALNRSFSEPLRVWYKPERIEFNERPYGFGPDQELSFTRMPVALGEFQLIGDVPTKPDP
jgi:hypothetical protein